MENAVNGGKAIRSDIQYEFLLGPPGAPGYPGPPVRILK